MKKLITLIAAVCLTLPMAAQTQKQKEVLDALRCTNEYFKAKWPDPTQPT